MIKIPSRGFCNLVLYFEINTSQKGNFMYFFKRREGEKERERDKERKQFSHLVFVKDSI